MSDLYRFIFSGDTVTGVFEVERDGSEERENIDANETYVRQTDGTVVKTETYATYREIKTYADANGDGIFLRISETYTDLSGNVIANSDDDDDSGDDNPGTTRGGAGRDLLRGGRGSDDLSGEDDDDDLFGEDGDDSINGGNGDDDLFGGDGDDDIQGGEGDDRIEDGAGDDSVQGGAGDDSLICSSGRGKDTYSGGDGTDDIVYDAITTSLSIDLGRGKASGRDIGSDRLSQIENVAAGSGNDKVTGSDTANVIDGGAGDDTLNGKGGNDRIVGGVGADRLTGGKGADIFVFQTEDDSGVGRERDQVRDFKLIDGDSIDLSAIDADTATVGDQAFSLVTAFSGSAGQLKLSGKVLAGDTDGDGVADFEIQVTGLKLADLGDAVIL